ncbi:hypothetical protein [Nocardioides sp.]|uniref:hypothetical protein n=1 Tax=Nocardioides sp. TaxID=35761 RepID=UPI0039E628D4
MDFLGMVYSGHVDDTFPLPQEAPFTLAMAREAGVSRWQLARLMAEGLLRSPVRGVYVSTALGDSLRLRVACLRLVVPQDCVVVDRHAGWVLGADMVLAPGEHLELRPVSIFRPSGNGRVRNGITRSGERWLREEDVVEVDGLRVTTPIRTAWDLGRVRWPEPAIAGIDQMLRLGAFTLEELLAGVEQFRGQRWVTTLRAIAPLGDGRAESPPESILRLRCVQNRLPMTPQLEVRRGGTFLARLDLGNEELMVAAEYDGVEWHSSPEQLERDRSRRTAAADDGWLIEVFVKENLFGRTADADAKLVLLRRDGLARRGLRIAS